MALHSPMATRAMSQIGIRAQSAEYASGYRHPSPPTSSGTARRIRRQSDEEAASLLQFQQAYQASAKVIQVAQTIFDTLIQNLGRWDTGYGAPAMTAFLRLGPTHTTRHCAISRSANRPLANLQENLTAGKRVLRASDDPTAAAQAERAITRLERIKTDPRIDSQRNAISQAEHAGRRTGCAVKLSLVVSAGNGSHTAQGTQSHCRQLQACATRYLRYRIGKIRMACRSLARSVVR